MKTIATIVFAVIIVIVAVAAQKVYPQNQGPKTPVRITSPTLKKRWLAAHNSIRRQYHLPKLAWDTTLEASAAAQAMTCTNDHVGAPSYAQYYASSYSETLYAVPAWNYAGPGGISTHLVGNEFEIMQSNWNCAKNKCSAGTSCIILTKVLAKTTNRVGCAMVHCPAPLDQFIVDDCGIPKKYWTYSWYSLICRFPKYGNNQYNAKKSPIPKSKCPRHQKTQKDVAGVPQTCS